MTEIIAMKSDIKPGIFILVVLWLMLPPSPKYLNKILADHGATGQAVLKL